MGEVSVRLSTPLAADVRNPERPLLLSSYPELSDVQRQTATSRCILCLIASLIVPDLLNL